MELNETSLEVDISTSEKSPNGCQCCLSCLDLQKMVEENTQTNTENYCDMLEYSFSIQVNTLSKSLWICMKCIAKLRQAYDFRKEVEKTQSVIWEYTKLEIQDKDSDKDVQIDNSEFNYSNYKSDYNGIDANVDQTIFTEKQEFEDIQVITSLDCNDKLLIVRSNINSEEIDDKSKLFVKTEPLDESIIRTRKKRKLKGKTNKKGTRLKNVHIKSATKRREKELWKNLTIEFTNASSRKDLLPFKIEKQLSNRKCELCGKTFVCCKDLQNHMHEHYPDHVCHICGKFYATQTTLNSHIERVHEPPKFKCPECGKNYRNRNSIRSHIVTVHRGEKLVTSYKCPDCNESFTTYYRRIVHMVDKHGLEPYKCQECGKSFINCGTLRTHVRKDHRMERKFQCEQCTKSFFSNRDLAKHMICHNGEKIFQCKICVKSYARKKTLIEHMKSHDPVKAHICSVCGRGFTQKCTMNVHMKTHEKECGSGP